MIPAIKAEFRKLVTVRSTYVISGLATALVIFFAFYIEGYKLGVSDVAYHPNLLASDVTGALSTTAIFASIIAILLVSHEYRYNTIMHTLTATNNRMKVLVGKFLAVSAYALLFAAFIGVLSPVMSYLGIRAHGMQMPHQIIHYGDLIWRTLFYGWGTGMIGLVISVLVRNQVASIVSMFLIPGVVENLLGLLLKKDTIYLPFSSLDQVINSGSTNPAQGMLTPGKAAGVFAIYLVVGWIVAAVLFVRRDAN
ncbi:MAG TPA: ABC transporter permease subunit [Candidatus Saccharimonadales bacterium]|nr:ABC transporter permease subunit [Candidatus Saccharimonadales bacterium]